MGGRGRGGGWFPVTAHLDSMLWQGSASTLQAGGCTVARNLTHCTQLASATKPEKKIKKKSLCKFGVRASHFLMMQKRLRSVSKRAANDEQEAL